MGGVVKPLFGPPAFPMQAVLSNPWSRYVGISNSTTDA
jgi:hypothetical protein